MYSAALDKTPPAPVKSVVRNALGTRKIAPGANVFLMCSQLSGANLEADAPQR
jgi:hypothetical protein